jgi:fibronectin-binding autotransporter adhesin
MRKQKLVAWSLSEYCSPTSRYQKLGFAAAAAAAVVSLAHSSFAANGADIWQGSAGSTDWVTAGNWSSASVNKPPASGDSLVFTSTNASPSATLTDSLTSTSFNVAGITFNASSPAYTMTGNSFMLTGGITNNSSVLQTINNTGVTSVSGDTGGTLTQTTGISVAGSYTFNVGGSNAGISLAGLQFVRTNNTSDTTTINGTGGTLTIGYLGLGSQSSSRLNQIFNGTGNISVGTMAPGGSSAPSTDAFTYSGTGTFSLTGSHLGGSFADAINSGTFLLSGNEGSGLGLNGSAIFTESTTGILSGTVAFTDSSTATATLAGANTYTGGTVLNAGTLVLDHSVSGAPATNIIGGANTALTLGGATLSIKGNSAATNSDKFNGTAFTTLTSSKIIATQNGATSLGLTLGGFTRNAQSTVDLTLPAAGSITTTSTTFATNGVLVSAASNGVAFATANAGAAFASNTAGTIGTVTPAAGTYGSTLNVSVGVGDAPSSGSGANTLTFTGAGDSVTFTGTNAITTGGILNSSSATGASTITGGTITAGAGKELAIFNYEPTGSGSLTISSVIADNAAGASALTIAGIGTTSLGAANTFTGQTAILGGSLQLANALALQNSTVTFPTNAVASGLTFASGIGTFTVGGLSDPSTTATIITLTDTAAQPVNLQVGNNNTSTTYDGGFTGGTVTKIGTGTLTLAGTNNFTSALVVNAGSVYSSNINPLQNVPSVTINNGGVVYYARGSVAIASGAVTDTVTVNSGGIISSDYVATSGSADTTIGAVTLNGGTIATRNQPTTGTPLIYDRGTFGLGGSQTAGTAAVNAGGGSNPTSTISAVNVAIRETGGTIFNVSAGSGTGGSNNPGGGVDLLFSGTILSRGNNANTTLIKQGNGVMELTGANAFITPVQISAGTLQINSIANGGVQTTATGTSGGTSVTVASATGLAAGQAVGFGTGSNINAGSTIGSGYTSGSTTVPLAIPTNSTDTGTLTGAVNTTLNFGTANPLGISTNAASNLIIDGGTLQYVGGTGSTDRLFQVGTTTVGAIGSVDASGSGPLTFTNAGALTYGTTGQTRTLNLTGTNTGANTLTPAIGNNGAGSVGLTKNGVGSWTLAGANTYSGPTIVNAGTLSTGATNTLSPNSAVTVNGGTLNIASGFNNQIASLSGGASGTVTIGSATTLTIGGSNISASFGGPITGQGGLTLNTAGISTQTLTGANTYSGPTTVTAGNLALAGTGQILGDTAITVAGGATLTTQPGMGNLTIGASNASLTLNAGAKFSMVDGSFGTTTLNGAGSTSVLTLGGTSTSPTNLAFELSSTGTQADELVVPNGNISYPGSVNDISLVAIGSGGPTNFSNIPLIYAPNSSNGIVLSDYGLSTTAIKLNNVNYVTSLSTENGSANGDYLYLNLTAATGGSSYFTGNGGNGSWATANNFATDHTGISPQSSIPAESNVVLTADSATNFSSETLDGSYTVNSLTFTGTNTAAAGNSITLTAGTGGTLTLNASSAFNITSGSTPVTTSYSAGIGLVVQPGSGSNTISAPIVLLASQTWENDSASGILTVNGGISDGGLSYSLSKTGVGTLVLGGTNTYSGGTVVTAGTLQLASGDVGALPASGTLTINGGTFDLNGNSESLLGLSDGGVATGTLTSSTGTPTLTFTGSNPVTFSGAITGPVSLSSSGGATVTLSGSNTYTGLTNVSSGVIVAASNSALGSSSALTAGLVLSGAATADFTSVAPAIASLTGLSSNSVVLGNSTTSSPTQLTVGGNGTTTTFAGVISDLHASKSAAVGSLNVAGGTLVLTNANTYTGTTAIASGATLQLGNNGATGALAGTGGAITDNGILALNRTSAFTQGTDFSSSPIGGTGSVVLDQGQVTLNEANNYSGGTYVNAGILALSGVNNTISPTAAGTGTIYLGSNGNSSNASISSGGNNAAVTYTNAIVVEPGGNRYTYTANAPTVTYAGPITLVGGATLGFGVNGNSPYITMTGGVSGTGNLELGCPIASRTTTFNISGGTLNNVGTVSDYITYGAQLAAGSSVNISANIGANVTGLIQDAPNAIMTLTGSNTYTGGTNVSAGKLVLGSANAFPSNGSAGTALTISSGSTLQIANHTALSTSSFVPIVSSLSNSGTIDLTNNAMILKNDTASIETVYTQIQTAFAGGTWAGNSSSGDITSSLARADTTHLTAIGFATGLTSFEGQSVSASDVLVKYTYYGDANLDGKVDGSDYSLIDNGYLQQLTGWYNGDFNYDGVIDGSDYTLIDNAFNSQGANISAEVASPTAQIAGGVSAVPEPSTLGLLGIGAMGLLGRRANRKRR